MCKLKLYVPKNSPEKYTKYDLLDKTIFARPKAIQFLLNQKTLLTCLNYISDQIYAYKCRLVYQQALFLITIASSPNPSINESTWLLISKKFK